MKQRKEKKIPTVEEQISLTRVSVIIWSIIAVIWFFLGVMKIVGGDEWWIIVLDFLVGTLSAVDALLGFIRLKRLKATPSEKTDESRDTEQDG